MARPSGGMTPQLRRLQRCQLAWPAGAASGRHPRADHRSAHRLSDRLHAARRGPARHRPFGHGGGQAPGGQDRHLIRIPRASGSSASRPTWPAASMSASTIPARWARTSWPRRTGRHGRGPDLPRFHEGRAGRCAAHAVPRRARHRGSAGRLESAAIRCRPAHRCDHGSLQGRAPRRARPMRRRRDVADDVGAGAAPGTASVSPSNTPPASVGEGTGGPLLEALLL